MGETCLARPRWARSPRALPRRSRTLEDMFAGCDVSCSDLLLPMSEPNVLVAGKGQVSGFGDHGSFHLRADFEMTVPRCALQWPNDDDATTPRPRYLLDPVHP